jgi:hypothetical protein
VTRDDDDDDNNNNKFMCLATATEADYSQAQNNISLHLIHRRL